MSKCVYRPASTRAVIHGYMALHECITTCFYSPQARTMMPHSWTRCGARALWNSSSGWEWRVELQAVDHALQTGSLVVPSFNFQLISRYWFTKIQENSEKYKFHSNAKYANPPRIVRIHMFVVTLCRLSCPISARAHIPCSCCDGPARRARWAQRSLINRRESPQFSLYGGRPLHSVIET